MTNAQIATRKDIYRRFRRLPDNKATQVLDFLDSIEEYEPNEETIAAFKEAENPENLTRYESLKEMFEDIGVDVKC